MIAGRRRPFLCDAALGVPWLSALLGDRSLQSEPGQVATYVLPREREAVDDVGLSL